MNLLGIQDVLKNASDQQLMQLMRSPDSTAPSYLVLSELSRRKEMRAHQAQQAQQPRSTVAEDLTKDDSTYADQQGIRSLRMPGYEDEAQAAETNPDEGIEAMRQGGIVRMAAGTPNGVEGEGEGEIPAITFGRNVIQGAGDVARGLVTPDAEMARRVELERARNFFGNQSNGLSWFTTGANTRNRNSGYLEYLNRNANNPNLDIQAFRTNPEEYIKNNPFTTPAAAPPAAAPSAAGAAAPSSPFNPSVRGSGEPELFQPRSAVPAGAGNRPAGTNTPAGAPANSRAPAGGGGPAPTSSIRALTPSEERPNMQSIMDRNLQMIPGIPQELLDRIKSSRTNEGDRRREAQNMALIEAGLRIASSNNPRLGAAIAEGAAPAVQSYGQQLSQIRQDQRADLQTDLATAEADIRRRYMAGQISSAEYRTALTELGARERMIYQQNAENARHAASMGSAAASRVEARQATVAANEAQGRFTPERWARMSEAEKQAAREVQQLSAPPRNADVSGVSSAANTSRLEADAARLALDMRSSVPRPRNPAEVPAWEALNKAAADRLNAAVTTYNEAMRRLMADRPGSPGVGTGTLPPPPPGYRIQQ